MNRDTVRVTHRLTQRETQIHGEGHTNTLKTHILRDTQTHTLRETHKHTERHTH